MGGRGTSSGGGGGRTLNNVSASAKEKHVKDVFANAGMPITDVEAQSIVSSVERWSDNDYTTVRLIQRWEADNGRELPNTSNAYQYKVIGDNVEKYIAVAPKVSGTLYRGVSSSSEYNPMADVNRAMATGGTITMGGTSSWSKQRSVAQDFSTAGSPVIFRVANSKSGVSIQKLSKLKQQEILMSKSVQFKPVKVTPVSLKVTNYFMGGVGGTKQGYIVDLEEV